MASFYPDEKLIAEEGQVHEDIVHRPKKVRLNNNWLLLKNKQEKKTHFNVIDFYLW